MTSLTTTTPSLRSSEAASMLVNSLVLCYDSRCHATADADWRLLQFKGPSRRPGFQWLSCRRQSCSSGRPPSWRRGASSIELHKFLSLIVRSCQPEIDLGAWAILARGWAAIETDLLEACFSPGLTLHCKARQKGKALQAATDEIWSMLFPLEFGWWRVDLKSASAPAYDGQGRTAACNFRRVAIPTPACVFYETLSFQSGSRRARALPHLPVAILCLGSLLPACCQPARACQSLPEPDCYCAVERCDPKFR
ncbi:hypothetical protein B0T17DRAFT_19003 [Bombardia bombarda]|uniref:Uncharacterized protein n=1 Tax=Bombardia bombarda TaxID=252184 RepID=A0AA39XIV4_9PEZI|nr:hypothetical protein B0T17DRAFT_19003 [Bombardia bombarda]